MLAKFRPVVDEREFEELALSPEKKLLYAILQRAYADLTDPAWHRPSDMRDAGEWIESENQCAFSFEWICQILDISVAEARAYAKKIGAGEVSPFTFRSNQRGWGVKTRS